MTAIDELMPDYSSGKGTVTRVCILCRHRVVWQRIPRAAQHNRREGSRARAAMLRHIKTEHPDAYAAAREHDQKEREHQAEAQARWEKEREEERARMTPFELGKEAFWSCITAAERYNVRAGMLDNCPFEKGTPEEAEYDRGWEAAMEERAARPWFPND